MKAKNKSRTKKIALIGLFAAVTAILAQISFYIPVSPVPVSFGIMAVFIAGLLLDPPGAFFSLLIYLALGATGLPVFSGGRGGFEVLLGPTGGFLFSYPLAALVISAGATLFDRLFNPKNPKVKRIAFHIFAFIVTATAFIFISYTLGTVFLSAVTGMTFKAALAAAVYPFIVLDLIKIAVCSVLIPPVRSRIKCF